MYFVPLAAFELISECLEGVQMSYPPGTAFVYTYESMVVSPSSNNQTEKGSSRSPEEASGQLPSRKPRGTSAPGT